jgi:D-3-phosphoglycerate dehydrogenase
MKIAVLDDTFDTLRGLPCFSKLRDHEVEVWNDHVDEVAVLAARLSCRRASTQGRLAMPPLSSLGPWCLRPRESFRSKCPRSKQGNGRPAWAARCAGRHSGSTATAGSARWSRATPRRSGCTYWCGLARRRALGLALTAVAQRPREAFFETCDVISLHLRLVEETRGIVTAADLARMKASALLVNTSRAGLIEPGALVNALRAGLSNTELPRETLREVLDGNGIRMFGDTPIDSGLQGVRVEVRFDAERIRDVKFGNAIAGRAGHVDESGMDPDVARRSGHLRLVRLD